MTFAVSSVPPSMLSLPIRGPHRPDVGIVCFAAEKGCCYHFTAGECMAALRRGKAYRRMMERRTRANPYR